MKKGYIFTVDALIAIILIIIFSGFMVISHPSADDSGIFDNYKQQTEDVAFVGHYLDKDSSHFGMNSNLTGLDNEYCTYNLNYDIKTGSFNLPTKYCKGGN